MKNLFFVRVVVAILGLLFVSACQSTTESNQSTVVREKSAEPRAMRHSEIFRVFGGKTFSAPTEKLVGDKSDAYRQSITYLRDDTNRAYRYYPNWTRGGSKFGKLDYYALGAVAKTKSQGEVVFRGKTYKKPDLVCFQDELNNNSHYCTTVFAVNGDYFFGLAENDAIRFSESYHNFMTPIVKRAVGDNNNKLLWALAGDFRRQEPDLVSKFRRADMKVWAARQTEIRAHNAKVDAARERANREQASRKAAEQRAYEKRRAAQEAKCRRETGSACKGSGGGLLGAALRGTIRAVESAGSSTGSGYVSAPRVESTAKKPTKPTKGISKVSRDGAYTVIQCVDGRKRKVHHNSYGKCEMPSNFGSYPCNYAIEQTKKSCF